MSSSSSSSSRLADAAQRFVAGSLGVTTAIAAGWFIASGARILSQNAATNPSSSRKEEEEEK